MKTFKACLRPSVLIYVAVMLVEVPRLCSARFLNVMVTGFKSDARVQLRSLEKHGSCFSSSTALWEENNYELINLEINILCVCACTCVCICCTCISVSFTHKMYFSASARLDWHQRDLQYNVSQMCLYLWIFNCPVQSSFSVWCVHTGWCLIPSGRRWMLLIKANSD